MQAILTRPRPPRPRPGPRLFAFAPTLHVHPGGRVRFVVRVSNGDARGQTAHFGLAGLAPGWKATLSQADILVPARGHALLALRLDAPEEAHLGERHTLRLAAEMGGHQAFLDLEAVVDNRL
ncbi:MAG: hypothetical protein QOI63_2040 [Thermoplasmata archaeon]|jgi:hypothetical protein|nr:hypothetical protein [Thermoplasmata archaeon]